MVTMTFKRDLGLAKFSGVVVCSPRLGWAVVSYLDFFKQLRFQEGSKGGGSSYIS